MSPLYLLSLIKDNKRLKKQI
uniref:Uncharacterized protein n=1 Tax=Anguilla anguilla TaxID=7936 RepID=A0A0E9PTF5_ANGAN